MKRILLVLVAVGAVAFGIRALVHLLVSDETKIRWIVEEMEDSFNDASASGCIEAIATDWSHADAKSLDRTLLHQGLIRTFFDQRGGDKRFLLRVEVPEDELLIEVADDAADVTAVVKFYRQRGEEWGLSWHMEIDADFRDGENGWEIRRTAHTNVEGQRF